MEIFTLLEVYNGKKLNQDIYFKDNTLIQKIYNQIIINMDIQITLINMLYSFYDINDIPLYIDLYKFTNYMLNLMNEELMKELVEASLDNFNEIKYKSIINFKTIFDRNIISIWKNSGVYEYEIPSDIIFIFKNIISEYFDENYIIKVNK